MRGNNGPQEQFGDGQHLGSGNKAGRDNKINVQHRIVYGRAGLVAIVAVVLVAIFAFLILQILPLIHNFVVPSSNSVSSPTPVATPADTLTSFCAIIRSGMSDYAYTKLYSDHLKQQVAPSQFQQEWSPTSSRSFISCIGNITNSSDTSATGTITGQDFPSNQIEVYNVALVKDETAGYWKIDSIQKQ